MEKMLLEEIRPRLRVGIAETVPIVGADDREELLQDGLVIALRILQAAEKAGKTITPGNVAYYTLRHLRSGHRSYGRSRTDPLHSATRLRGRSQVYSLEEPVTRNPEPDGEAVTLGEALASQEDDPATQAARRLDWGQLSQSLDGITKEIIRALVTGQELTRLGRRLGRSRSVLQRAKYRLAALIRKHLGEDILCQVQAPPGWRDNMDILRQRKAYRWERRVA